MRETRSRTGAASRANSDDPVIRSSGSETIQHQQQEAQLRDEPLADPILLSDLDLQLQEAREWYQREAKEEELRRITELKGRKARGEDITAFLGLRTSNNGNTGSSGPVLSFATTNNAKLPQPDRPRYYKAKSLWEYQEWTRENEEYHHRSAASFQTEGDKVSFSQQYIHSDLKPAWHGLVKDERAKDPLWTPIWDDLSTWALNRLGPAYEREQKAFDELRTIKQNGRLPIDLLSELRPLWVETAMEKPSLQVKSFISALDEDIRKKVVYDYLKAAETVQEAEDRALRAYRQREGPNKKSSGPGKRKRPDEDKEDHKKDSSKVVETKETTKESKKPKGGKKWSKKVERKQYTKDADGNAKKTPLRPIEEVECFKCHKKGHYASSCPEKESAGKE